MKRFILSSLAALAYTTTAWAGSVTLLGTGSVSSAPPIVGFDFSPNFNGVADGTLFQTWNSVQQSVFNSPAIVSQWNNDFQSSTNHMWFVTLGSACGTGHTNHLLKNLLPAGDLGVFIGVTGYGYQNQIVIRFRDTAAAPIDVLNITFDQCLDSAYYLGSLSKFSPKLGYGDPTQTGATNPGPSSTAFGYECRPQPPPANPGCATGAPGSTGPPKVWNDYSIVGGNGELSGGDHDVITTNTWHNFQIILKRGASGYYSFYEDGVRNFTGSVTNICNASFQAANPGCSTGTAQGPFIEFTSWFGGGSSVYSPPVNSIAYYDNIRIRGCPSGGFCDTGP